MQYKTRSPVLHIAGIPGSSPYRYAFLQRSGVLFSHRYKHLINRFALIDRNPGRCEWFAVQRDGCDAFFDSVRIVDRDIE